MSKAADVYLFDELLVERQDMTFADSGRASPMFGLRLRVAMQDAAGKHPPQDLPTVWMEPHVATALIQALHSAMVRRFPEEAARAASEAQASGTTRPLQ